MLVRVAVETSRLRSFGSFGTSACIHGGLLAWLLFTSAAIPERRKSIYDQEIRPNEKKLIWYSLRDKLPEVSPPDAGLDRRPPRAREKAPQTIVAGKQDEPKPSQFIWTPEPEAAAPKPRPLPNVIAVAPPPKVVRPFEAPPEKTAPPKIAPPVLPDAPQVAAAIPNASLPVTGPGPKPAPRAFTPPPEVRLSRQAAILLPEAPTTAPQVVEPNALPFAGPGAKPQPRAFVPPPSAGPRASGPASLPAAPEVATAQVNGNALAKVPRAFVPPPSRPAPANAHPGIPSDAPAVNGVAGPPSEATMAIVGLNPVKTTDIPAPPGSHAAGFSAGPETRTEGGAGGTSPKLLNVPGLVVGGGPKDTKPTLVVPPFDPTSAKNLSAAARVARTLPPRPAVDESRTTPIVEAPDPRLSGRVVYTVAIQMPNVTSFSGSWQVWFAEHEPEPGTAIPEVHAPVPLRKVDPKYIAAAAADRVEGKVRLFGVIRKNGTVDSIALLRHLDGRLDASATEALMKWQFQPATRNGKPVDVDAVFEIPFHLAPRPK